MPDIHHQVLISASKSAIFYAITQQKGLSKWWMADATAKPEPGFVNEFKFGDMVHNKFRITKLEENKLVEWECLNRDEWEGTFVRFELSDKGKFTAL
ncbi:MAG TPA: SRPBCC domain-containing protein, partial [Flavobacteriales bacterium]|nr:SRPBCC domain-containing protein [Flavobacteriales bacterium]